MENWERFLTGFLALMLAAWLWPSARAAVKRSKQVENPDWMAAVVPLILVVLFVALLLFLA